MRKHEGTDLAATWDGPITSATLFLAKKMDISARERWRSGVWCDSDSVDQGPWFEIIVKAYTPDNLVAALRSFDSCGDCKFVSSWFTSTRIRS